MADSSITSSAAQPPLMIDQVKRQIRARIGETWRIGDRLPPITDLARELGVGEKNTYRAVRALAKEGILASRPRHGTFVADRPAPEKNDKRTRHVIELPLGPDSDGMVQRMGRAFIHEMNRRGREVKLTDDLNRYNSEIDLTGYDADAMALLNIGAERVKLGNSQPIFSLIGTTGQPCSYITQKYDVVGPDNEQGGLLAGQLMRELNVKTPAFIGVGEPTTKTYRDLDALRLAGFERGYGKPVPAKHRFVTDAYSENAGAHIAREFSECKDRPEALFASTDDIAIGFVVGGFALNLIPRRDYFIIGFDGQSRVRSAFSGGITTVAVPVEAMGRQAAEFLDMRLEHPELPPRSMSLGCVIRRGKTMPKAEKPSQPFWKKEQLYWPAPPDKGESQ